MSPYENPMSSIYTILNRMKDNDEIEIRREGLNVFYKEIVKEVDEDDFSWTPDAEILLRLLNRQRGTVDEFVAP